jgi:hypothetical protein
VYWESLLTTRNFAFCGPDRSPFTPHAPQFVFQEPQESTFHLIPEYERVDGQAEKWVLHWLRESWVSYSLWLLLSVLIDPIQQFISLCRGGGCRNFVIQRACSWTFITDCQQIYSGCSSQCQVSVPSVFLQFFMDFIILLYTCIKSTSIILFPITISF